MNYELHEHCEPLVMAVELLLEESLLELENELELESLA